MESDALIELDLVALIGIVIAVVSLSLNVLQWYAQRRDSQAQSNFTGPLKKSVVGLFNQVKAMNLAMYQIQEGIRSGGAPHQALETLRWEYYQTTTWVMSEVTILQEGLVALYQTLEPTDREGAAVFRAADFGLTDDEKELRRRNREALLQRFTAAPSTPTAAAQPQPQPGKGLAR